MEIVKQTVVVTVQKINDQAITVDTPEAYLQAAHRIQGIRTFLHDLSIDVKEYLEKEEKRLLVLSERKYRDALWS